MTTDQTIDGVPRELLLDLEYWLKHMEAEKSVEGRCSALKDLRALLDAPAVENELDRLRAENERLLAGFYQQVTDADIKKISDYMGNPDMPTGAFLRQDAYDLANMTTHMCREVQALRIKLAAQPQGEPVVWANDQQLLLCSKSPRHDEPNNPLLHNLPRNIAGSALRTDYCNTPIYAEQPAPVDSADVEKWKLAHRLAMEDNAKLTMRLAEQPAPVAVVLPERLAQNTFYSDGWNACLDELKRLNHSL